MATIALIREPDLPRLIELYEELTDGEKTPLEAMRASFRAMEKDGRYFLIGVWEEGELSGSALGCVCRQLSHDTSPFMVMENFIVAAKHRRKGLGRLLMAELERIAVENGCRDIQFCSNSRRTVAHAFYASCGYDPGLVKGFRKYL